MARIRTVKPALLKHEGLFDLELETGLPLRIAFIGLFTCCDREGRFEWRPRTLKTDALPHDNVDFSRVLNALESRGFVCKYMIDGREYGVIPSFTKHQVINNKESQSNLPEPTETSYISTSCTCEPRVDDATTSSLFPTQGEGKGREGKGREEEGDCVVASPSSATLPVVVKPKSTKEPAPTAVIWEAYSTAYRNRYHIDPVRNPKVNGQLKQLLSRLGANEAPYVAAFYVGHNKSYYVQTMHSVDALVKDSEALRTQWATGQRMTVAAAQEADRLQNTGDMWGNIIAEHESKEVQ